MILLYCSSEGVTADEWNDDQDENKKEEKCVNHGGTSEVCGWAHAIESSAAGEWGATVPSLCIVVVVDISAPRTL